MVFFIYALCPVRATQVSEKNTPTQLVPTANHMASAATPQLQNPTSQRQRAMCAVRVPHRTRKNCIVLWRGGRGLVAVLTADAVRSSH